ncbi:glutamate-1-semialdehyde-2,1-aminomutase [Anoxybacter fermentans]|uniref:Glutamate-1-semialdehyde 2,1-aminomutase n=1 Tax=Anoxybacter fermentans TaxID=1323375 RepID=A0A3Q9HQC0_9FIRM|nr:glutamate-1-semialdehyde 2,1-aminomutase [Anoxybacter fermentans]AZR73291.1 glutamate-1-semialdehyde-2,1-aminomutase [Anoxybacter fermentans]
MEFTKSRRAFEEAKKVIPGGVNSPVRALKAVGCDPVFISRAKGAWLYDIDGNQFIDYIGSWGPMIVGHAHPDVVAALEEVISLGTSFGAPTELETMLAQMVLEAFPSMDKVRMVNSGTEATMSAIRLARAYTDRDLIVKMEGCYHGHADSLLIKAGSGATTLGVPTSPGVPQDFARNTISVPYNDLEILRQVFAERGEEIAAVILEPIPGNMGVVLPKEGYLTGLRELTKEYGALLIFDEVITGFRVAYGGAQELYGIDPDITCLGKIIGGGLPVGAYGGKEEIMAQVAPEGPVYQAGTLSGNPLAMAAGIATLRLLKNPGVYDHLWLMGKRLEDGIKQNLAELEIPAYFNRCGSMFTLFFTDKEVYDYQTALSSNTELYAKYFSGMLKEGIYLAPSQFEAGFISLAHTESEIDQTIEANYKVLYELKLKKDI